MLKIGIIVGSTRPNRVGPQVAAWIEGHIAQRDDARGHIVDLKEQALPLLDEPLPAMHGSYQHEHTRAWAATIESYDALVFVTPEYNQGMPGGLKNAIDFLFAEWKDKVVGIVSYGIDGGVESAAQLRRLCELLAMQVSTAQVALSLHTDFENFTVFAPGESKARDLDGLLDEVTAAGNVSTAPDGSVA